MHLCEVAETLHASMYPAVPAFHPAMMAVQPGDPAGYMLAGYHDCAEEAIRYLVEVENIPMDDPLIVGLKTHLKEHQKSPEFDQLLTGQTFHDVDSLSNSYVGFQQNVFQPPYFQTSHLNYHNQVLPNEPVSTDSDCNQPIIGEGVLTTQSRTDTSDERGHQSLFNLGTLSDNSVAIAALAEELLSLLEEGDSLSDMEDEDEDDVEQ